MAIYLLYYTVYICICSYVGMVCNNYCNAPTICNNGPGWCIHTDLQFLLFGQISGGDQVTVARVQGSKRIGSKSERGQVALEGLEPVVEDWHAKVCLLGVSIHVYIV